MTTTETLIQQVKNRIEGAINVDSVEASQLANTLDMLVNTKRMEQFIENERVENE